MTSLTDQSLPAIDIPLREGSMASLRPIGPGDEALISEGLAHMSMQSRIERFGVGLDHLSKAELDYLTDIDLVDHVAWGALIDGKPAGSGRYIRHENDPDCTEIAVAVVDEYQRRGLGRVLFDALAASARHNGIDRLCFSIQPFNEAVIRMMTGLESRLDEKDGMVEGSLAVADVPPSPYDPLYVALLVFFQGLR